MAFSLPLPAAAPWKEFFGIRLLHMVNILALSVTCGDTSPKGRGLGKKMKFAWTAKGSHFGGAGIA